MAKIGKKGVERQAGLFMACVVRGALAALVVWLLLGNLDWYDPWVNLKPETAVLRVRTEFLLEAGDKDSGLKDLRVSIIQAGMEQEIFSRTFAPRPGILGLMGAKGATIAKIEVPLVLDAKALGLRDGEAVILVTAHDHSWRNRFQGRIATLSRDVVINLKSPPERHGTDSR